MRGLKFLTVLLGVTAFCAAACDDEGEQTDGGGGSGGGAPHVDVTLDPPAEGAGFQMQTDSFAIAAGEEVQNCYFVRVPGEPGGASIYVNRILMRQNPGTHHGNIFRVKTVVGLGTEADVAAGKVAGGECWNSANWADWPLVTNSQESSSNEDVDWTLPAGVAHRFEPGELLMIQSHYVNATTQASPGNGKLLANFYTVPEAEVEHELGTLFTSNQNIRVCPGDTDKEYSQTCNFARDQEVTVIAANGHFHSRGTRFTIAPYDSVGGEPGPDFYVSDRWDDPPMARDLAVTIPADGGVTWTCTYTAPANSCGIEEDACCFDFGGKVETSEHCNIFVYYYPKIQDAGCF